MGLHSLPHHLRSQHRYSPTFEEYYLPYTLAAEYNYTHHATGPLTNAAPYLGWERLPALYCSALSPSTREALSRFPSDWPEIQYLVETAYPGTLSASPDIPYATFATALVAPLSRGNVTIVSNSTTDLPVMSTNWLTAPEDINLGIQALKRQRDVWNTPAMRAVRIGSEFAPGDNVTTDAQIEQYIRRTAIQLYHAACTCKMGTRNDSMAVLDSRSRVYEGQGLRVVDISAFPLLPPGHPQATVYMLAEKIADDIRNGR